MKNQQKKKLRLYAYVVYQVEEKVIAIRLKPTDAIRDVLSALPKNTLRWMELEEPNKIAAIDTFTRYRGLAQKI